MTMFCSEGNYYYNQGTAIVCVDPLYVVKIVHTDNNGRRTIESRLFTSHEMAKGYADAVVSSVGCGYYDILIEECFLDVKKSYIAKEREVTVKKKEFYWDVSV